MWPLYLPFAVLAVNSYFDLERNTSPSLKAYGFHIRTPGVPIFKGQPRWTLPTPNFIPGHQSLMQKATFRDATWAYVQNMHRSHKLDPLLQGPYPVLEKGDRYMLLQIGKEPKKISYQYLLPARPQVRPHDPPFKGKPKVKIRQYVKQPPVQEAQEKT